MQLVGKWNALMSATSAFGLALWLAGFGHFVVLIASFQVPGRLGWKDDLAKLENVKCDNVEHLKSHLEGEYSRKK